MSDISLQRYVTASAGGMLPCQSLHAYIGSTLRSMEEVVSSSSSSTAAYIVFSGQVCDHILLILLHCYLCNVLLVVKWRGFGCGCGTGFGARTSVAKLNIVSATHNNLVADTFFWLASIRMASEDVTWGDRMGGESETLASAAEWWVSSNCGLWEETEEAVFPDFRRYILPVMTLSDLYDLQCSDEIIIIIAIILIPQF